jgi:hypothetical protein
VLARALPPFRPPRRLLPVGWSSASPVAMRITWTALLTTSAGRFAPFGVLGILPTAYRRNGPERDRAGRSRFQTETLPVLDMYGTSQ